MTERIGAGSLETFVCSLFEAAGLPEEDARTCAGAIVLQEMRGVTTHGLRRLRNNLDALASGSARASASIRTLSDSGATTVLDGDRAVGIVACMAAMDRAIEKARAHGVGMAIVVNSNHFLGAAPYCLRAVDSGMLGICFSNSFPSMAYPGATKAVIGNAPFGYAVPTSLGFPLVYDAAMTTSGGKLLQWSREGEAIPQGFAGLDARGQPTLDPRAVLEGGTSLPIGLHKGAGLALLVEILTGVLGGGGFLHGHDQSTDPAWRMEAHSQSCIAVDAGHFMTPDELRDRVAAYGRDVKRFPAAVNEEILLPGERAHRTLMECREKGVPLDEEVAAELRGCAMRLGVTAPF